jgi:hypothetical protein
LLQIMAKHAKRLLNLGFTDNLNEKNIETYQTKADMTESLFPQKRKGLPEALAPLRGGVLWVMGTFCFGVRNLWERNAMLFS